MKAIPSVTLGHGFFAIVLVSPVSWHCPNFLDSTSRVILDGGVVSSVLDWDSPGTDEKLMQQPRDRRGGYLFFFWPWVHYIQREGFFFILLSAKHLAPYAFFSLSYIVIHYTLLLINSHTYCEQNRAIYQSLKFWKYFLLRLLPSQKELLHRHTLRC